MPDYRRYRIPGGCFFFTVNLNRRCNNHLLTREIELLRDTVRYVRHIHPFFIDGWAVMPEHMHCIWTLPPGDDDYAIRWRAIKALFSRNLPKHEYRTKVRQSRGERGIWQRRFWEHSIRDERDFAAHMDYLHYNPVKHGHVTRVMDWPYSSFLRWVDKGVYPIDWCGGIEHDVNGGE